MESNFSLELSFAELRWVAGAFGLAQLPLFVPSVSSEALLDVPNKLGLRGLIGPGQPVGWQVHPFVAMALQWMANAPRFWVFDCYRHNDQDAEFALFLQDEAALLVLPLAEGKRLVACRDMHAAITEWQLAMGLTDAIKGMNLSEWDIPQPITVIRAAWRNPALAQTMADANFLTWATGLDWAGEWALVMGENRFAHLALASRANALWVGRYAAGHPGEFLLRPYATENLAQTLVQAFKEGA